MDIRNNMTNAQASPNFGKFIVTKKAAELMLNRNELEAMNPLLPTFRKLGKKADIIIDANTFWSKGTKDVVDEYTCSVSPKRPSVVRAVIDTVAFLNPSMNKLEGTSSDLYGCIEHKKATTDDFKGLYREAHRQLKLQKAHKAELKAARNELNVNG